jgi:hypothetical protein
MSLTQMVLSAVLLLPIQVSVNQGTRVPLPARVLQAKTVFVDNQSGYVRARDEFADELGKWRRLRIVYSKANADLLVILTTQKTQLSGATQIVFVDPQSGENIWTNSMVWSEQGAVRDLIMDLRQRIEKQEKSR